MDWYKSAKDLFETTPRYYDREGNPLELMEWAKLCDDDNYNIVKQELVGKYFVSTVWIGLNMCMFKGIKLIFETMIFPQGKIDFAVEDPIRDYQERYSTEEEALAGHEKAVRVVKDLAASASRYAPEALE